MPAYRLRYVPTWSSVVVYTLKVESNHKLRQFTFIDLAVLVRHVLIFSYLAKLNLDFIDVKQKQGWQKIRFFLFF
jgi:hypothetical protein